MTISNNQLNAVKDYANAMIDRCNESLEVHKSNSALQEYFQGNKVAYESINRLIFDLEKLTS
jgi:hypothetical protein